MTEAGAYRWDEMAMEDVRTGLRRCAVSSDRAMVVFNEASSEFEPASHSHPHEQIALIVSGEGIFHVGGVAHHVRAGSVVIVPANVEHHLETTGSEPVHNIDIFVPPRQDYAHLVEWMGHRAR